MPIVNIIDHRTNKYNIKVDVVFEPSCHDNSISEATKFNWSEEFMVDALYETTIEDSIKYAEKYKTPTTMFLYDSGSKPVD
jgi:hypothetical protein